MNYKMIVLDLDDTLLKMMEQFQIVLKKSYR